MPSPATKRGRRLVPSLPAARRGLGTERSGCRAPRGRPADHVLGPGHARPGKTAPDIGVSKVFIFFRKKKTKPFRRLFFFFLALSFRRNLGMLLFKEKKCLQCISHPFRSEHDLCEEMVFLKN